MDCDVEFVPGRIISVRGKKVFLRQAELRVCIFSPSAVGGWYFDPWRWLRDGEFGLYPEELRYILMHPPFSFPLDSCRSQRRCQNDDCCQRPPSLTLAEIKKIKAEAEGALDFSGHFVSLRLKQTGIGNYCWFYEPGRGCTLFGDPLRPAQCRWSYCWGDIVVNSPDLVRYIKSLIGSPVRAADLG